MSSENIYTHPHFVDNKYNTLYFKIINNAKNRSETSGYTETHHIIPRSMNGTDLPENLVVLTAREHFICHYLLTKFTVGEGRDSMIHAFRRMKPNKQFKNRYFNSRLFELMRKEFSSTMKKLHTGKIVSEETKEKMSKAKKGKKLTSEHKEKISNSNKGRKHSEEARAKISSGNKGKIFSEESKAKLSESKKGQPSSRLGAKHSEESIKKMSESHKGKIISEETRLKLSNAGKGKTGRKHSEETKAKISKSKKLQKQIQK